MRAKGAKGTVVQLDYIIHIQEIKPWPPSQSLKTLRAVLIQWEYGAKKSGSTSQVVPSLGDGSSVGDGRIEFNESFRLQVTLTREKSIKARNGEHFVKNWIEFNLYEPRRDQTVKGQLLGTAVLDFADYGIIKQNQSIAVPINCKRTYGNTVQPLLFLSLQRHKSQANSTSNSLLREPSSERKHGVTSPDMMIEECGDEVEGGSFTTDDDVSSHSSLAISTSAAGGCASPQNKHDEAVTANCISEDVENGDEQDKHDSKADEMQTTDSDVLSGVCLSKFSSIDTFSDIAWISKRITSQSKLSSTKEEIREQHDSYTKTDEYDTERQSTQPNVESAENIEKVQLTKEEEVIVSSPFVGESTFEEIVPFTVANDILAGGISSRNKDDIGSKYEAHAEGLKMENEEQQDGAVVSGHIYQDDEQVQPKLESKLDSSNNGNAAVLNKNPIFDKSRNGKSFRSSMDSSRSHASARNNYAFPPDDVHGSRNSKLRDSKSCGDDKDIRIQHLELRMKVLETELREMAAIEASIYSVVAEHGSSRNKVHAPARRLWRFYSHASNQYGKSSRESAARSVVAGLVLVAKACGSDVPRLTFWLSNSIVLRVIVNTSMVDSQLPNYLGPVTQKADNEKKQSSALKWDSLPRKSAGGRVAENLCHSWANPSTFAAALEKVEAWMFSRIIESLWWQTFTPHMQSGAARNIYRSRDSESRKTCGRNTLSTEEQQANCSVELWKKAFSDTSERICPIRAEGHDCGCLTGLSKLIMEQLIARLDVAMFNAILRESSDETPTDPVADPISDAEVLPIPAGKASFGAGAQLKNAIGSWSRSLSDLFDIDDGDFLTKDNSSGISDDDDDERMSTTEFSKSFHLLNALSDLMMLPKDMLLSQTIRREVCPAFGSPLITRILSSFVPDEFCDDPIPRVVFQALNSEDPLDAEGDSIMSIPCGATPIVYRAPSPASVSMADKHSELTRTRSSLLRKSQTSDDELDELDSPLSAIITSSGNASPSAKLPWNSNTGSQSTTRHHLLREVWINSP